MLKGRRDTTSIKEQRCEWCGATEDLCESELGDPRQVILTCNNARECETRWPDEWPTGTLGCPEPKKQAAKGKGGEKR
jgi:hypothetical protein